MLLQSSHRQTPNTQAPAGIATAGQIVHDEVRWRRPPALGTSSTKIVPARWTHGVAASCEVSAEMVDDRYTLGIALRQMDVLLSASGRVLHDGRVLPGMLQLGLPGQSYRGVFRGAYDVLHLFIPKGLLRECYETAHGRPAGEEVALIDPCFSQDAVIERLSRALLMAVEVGDSVSALYADAVNLAIATRLLSVYSVVGAATAKRSRAALPGWRLKRAIDFIDSHLAEPVTLADIAQVTGLTRMHFAAQFRAATGARPHEYVLRRRIERAQDLLSRSDHSLVDVALSVGFQTQSHFTTVFKRFVGATPHQWRQSNGPTPRSSLPLPSAVLPTYEFCAQSL